jgi:DNA-binding CsgD family transcriptional regulator
VDRYGYPQTVLDTAPLLVGHLITDGGNYPGTGSLHSLVPAALEHRRLSAPPSKMSGLPDELTEAEVRALEKLPAHLTYADMASELHLSLNTIKTLRGSPRYSLSPRFRRVAKIWGTFEGASRLGRVGQRQSRYFPVAYVAQRHLFR